MKEEKFMAIGVKTEIYGHAIAGSFYFYFFSLTPFISLP